MATLKSEIPVKVKFAWWFKYLYMPVVYSFSYLFGIEPKRKTLDYWISKGVTIEVVGGEGG